MQRQKDRSIDEDDIIPRKDINKHINTDITDSHTDVDDSIKPEFHTTLNIRN